jgi:hypothetical protein
MKKLLIALAAVALVGGCVKVEKSLPKDLPPYVSVYPGATQVVSMEMGPASVVAFQAAASPDDVIGYYRSQASSNGLVEAGATPSASASSAYRQSIFRDPATKRMMVVAARPQAAGTMVTLTYTKGGGPS